MTDQEYFSIRMRASVLGRHELGGKHISGGEQLCGKADIIKHSSFLVAKALEHSRGEPDFLQITIERVEEPVTWIHPLPVDTYEVNNEHSGRQLAKSLLIDAGIKEDVVNQGIIELSSCLDTRGAIIIDALTGKRIDDRGSRGVRVSRIDWDLVSYNDWLLKHAPLKSIKIKEALALATKVSSHPNTVAELCWSDDPDYVTGYVATQKHGYRRITKLKTVGDESGGRVYFAQLHSERELEQYIHFLEKTPTLLKMENPVNEEANTLVTT